MQPSLSTLKNDCDFIRNLIMHNNIIWYLMYYDELLIKPNYQLTLLKNADLLFYNTAQAVSSMNIITLQEIETHYLQNNINPAFYLDPASITWLKPFLIEHGYSEMEAELENWWGIVLTKDILQNNFQDYLKINENTIRTKIIDSRNINDLNQFLTINQTASQLPDVIVDKLRINMQKRIYSGATNTLLIVYVNDIPASVRALGLYKNMAFLAEAGTLLEFRQLGLHIFTTLFLLKHAYERGAEFAALTCTHDSVTNFTSKRSGLELLFQRQLMINNNCRYKYNDI